MGKEKTPLELAEWVIRTGWTFRGESVVIAKELIRLHREVKELRAELGIEEE